MAKKLLCICGDFYHPAQVPAEGLAFLGELGWELDIRNDGRALTKEYLDECAAVILTRGDSAEGGSRASWYTDDEVTALCDYVRSGGGLVAIHAGLTCDDERIRELVGCRFLYHPEQCKVRTAPLCPHGITEGVGEFALTDEHYVVGILAQVTPLLTSASDAELNCGGYVRSYGDGRVCALMPGHNPEVWANADFSRAIKQAVEWAQK